MSSNEACLISFLALPHYCLCPPRAALDTKFAFCEQPRHSLGCVLGKSSREVLAPCTSDEKWPSLYINYSPFLPFKKQVCKQTNQRQKLWFSLHSFSWDLLSFPSCHWGKKCCACVVWQLLTSLHEKWCAGEIWLQCNKDLQAKEKLPNAYRRAKQSSVFS